MTPTRLKELAIKYRPKPRSKVKYMVPAYYYFYNWTIKRGIVYNSYFDHIKVIGGCLDDVILESCTFRDSIFMGVTFDRLRTRRTVFFNTKFNHCIFRFGQGPVMAVFVDCRFDNCEFSGYTYLSGNDIPGCSLMGCTFSDGVSFDRDSAISFDECENVPYIPMTCPEEDAFFGYKLATFVHRDTGEKTDGIVTVYIPQDAKRSSSYGRKCRCNKATVIGIEKRNGEKLDGRAYNIHSWHDPDFIYHVNDTIFIDDFEEDRWQECAPGFHFFINKEEARRYG